MWGHCTPSACFDVWPVYCFLAPGTCLLAEAVDYTVLEPLKATVATTGASITLPLQQVRGSVETAVDEDIKTSGEVVKEMMKPDGNPTQKIQEWVTCWGPAFVGLGDFSGTACVPVKLVDGAVNKKRPATRCTASTAR